MTDHDVNRREPALDGPEASAAPGGGGASVRGLSPGGWVLPVLWALGCTAAYAALSLLRFRRFEPTSWDNAIFEQAVRGYAGLGWPIVDIKGPGFNVLGDHFSPITALLAPFYAVFPSAQTLLVGQALLLGVSVLVVGRLASRHVGPWAAGALTVAYGLSFGVSAAVRSDFHEVAFGAPLLALAGAAYVDRRWRAVVGWSLPLLLVKEDMGATVLMIGLVLMLAGERRRGTLLAAVGVVGAALVVLVVLPSVNPGGVYDYASSVGGDRGVLATLLDEPGRKAWTVVLTLAVTGFAALGSPWVLLVLPTFAWRFVGDNPFYWGTDWHYSLLLMTIVVVAAIDTMRRIPVTRWLALPALAFTAVMLPSTALWALTEPQTYEVPPRAEVAQQVVDLVPDGASVVTDIGLITHLATDRDVYWLGTVGNGPMPAGDPQYVLLDQLAGVGSPPDARTYAEETFGGSWVTVWDADGYQLARRD
ncbi:DUF2079 domain-containing protein [Aeromicrobium sp. Leaf272]|uniref:DUF2079 domain-containing protein n=1 Tax=Aeromicrobium sp. Leaf272 TaxID=1736317 RepID=UPI0006FC69DC|nr:DUF2079 domain-containing protein [Aeromicrobium sp. Leaf272]KQP25910.1 hypothetical protein ASF38_09465 [Aeromicrobium sp. Leaf272]